MTRTDGGPRRQMVDLEFILDVELEKNVIFKQVVTLVIDGLKDIDIKHYPYLPMGSITGSHRAYFEL